MIISKFIEYIQKNIKTYMFTVNSEMLLNETIVDYYEDDKSTDTGYQRPLSEIHYKNIAKYLINDSQSMLPTAIIGAINSGDIEANIGLHLSGKIRIVDGQHRREAIQFIKDNHTKIYDAQIKAMEFPVLLMEINKKELNEYIIEVQTFVNINKKGRKVSTDLAISLEEMISNKLLKNEGFTNESLAIGLIAKRIVDLFNNDPNTCWFKGIKTGDCNDKGRPISKNAFNNSIEPIISKYIDVNYPQFEKYNEQIIEIVSDELYKLLKEIWEIVAEKWTNSFYWDQSELFAEFDKDYSIQRGIGVYPIHSIVSELDLKKDFNILTTFKSILLKSEIDSDDWIKGGVFSGFNSASGFKKIEEAILDNDKYKNLASK